MLLSLATLLQSAACAQVPAVRHPQLRYWPYGDAITTINGGGDYNRPLYCNQTWPVVYAGDRPRLVGLDWNGIFGRLNIAYSREGHTMWLHEFSHIESRYQPGRMSWILNDERFSGLKLRMNAVTLASGVGFAVKLTASGGAANDRLLTHYGGYQVGWGLDGQSQVGMEPTDIDVPYAVAITKQGFTAELEHVDRYLDNPPPLRVVAQFSQAVDMRSVSSSIPKGAAELVADASLPGDKAVCASTHVGNDTALYFSVHVHTITHRAYSIYNKWDGVKNLTPSVLQKEADEFAKSLGNSPAVDFDTAWKHAEAIGSQVKVDTPDAYLNAQVAAANSAIYGLYVNPVFTHGGSQWRCQMPGWRMLDGATAFGWHQLVEDEAKYYIPHMITTSELIKPSANKAGTEEALDSRYYGKGRIDLDQGNYNFQVQFFEELIRSWRHTGDKQLEAMLLPALELHLERAKECFDPDSDGLYESYINTWPTDSVGYNGGGSVEESAYCYYMHLAAAEMCSRKGDVAGSLRHKADAAKIKNALHTILWLKKKGHFGAYKEHGGYERVHEDAWLYSQFLPIDLGIANESEAMRALYYTEWGLERVKLPYGGELCVTSNWVPSIWSVREMYGGDIYHLALSYFRSGQADAGWQLLKGTYMESGYGDLKPKALYGNTTNKLSPGGISHPAGSIDFSDITSMFGRCVVEGLYGYLPDYPNHTVVFQPAIPTEWPHAAISNPDFKLSFNRQAETDHYEFSLTKAAKMVLRLPVYGQQLVKVSVNGKSVASEIVASYGHGIAIIKLPETAHADVKLVVSKRRAQIAAKSLNLTSGQTVVLPTDHEVLRLDDSQCALVDSKIVHNKITATCTYTEGNYAVMALVKADVPYWQMWKIHVDNPKLQKRQQAKNLQKAQPNAEWSMVDISQILNGDVRRIYKQDYKSPRPNTCSVRIGHDGYQAWTMAIWGMAPPRINLGNVLDEPDILNGYWIAKDRRSFGYRDEITIDAWLVPDILPEGGARIVDRTRIGTLDGYMLDTYPGNSLRLLTSNGMLSAPNVLTPCIPVRVTAVYSSSKHIAKLYKNGKLIATASEGSFPALTVPDLPLRIGSDAEGKNVFGGSIQRVVIYGKALSDQEVQADDGLWAPAAQADAEWILAGKNEAEVKPTVGDQAMLHQLLEQPSEHRSIMVNGHIETPQGVRFRAVAADKNIAFTSLWDNWPDEVNMPINRKAEAIWLMVCGSTQPLQGRIANAAIRFVYEDGIEERLELVPPLNYRSLCSWGGSDYNPDRDAFALGSNPPMTVSLGVNCRAMVYGWMLRPGVKLSHIKLETLSQEVVIGLMGVSLMNPID